MGCGSQSNEMLLFESLHQVRYEYVFYDQTRDWHLLLPPVAIPYLVALNMQLVSVPSDCNIMKMKQASFQRELLTL
jgi:hypothetical protein